MHRSLIDQAERFFLLYGISACVSIEPFPAAFHLTDEQHGSEKAYCPIEMLMQGLCSNETARLQSAAGRRCFPLKKMPKPSACFRRLKPYTDHESAAIATLCSLFGRRGGAVVSVDNNVFTGEGFTASVGQEHTIDIVFDGLTNLCQMDEAKKPNQLIEHTDSAIIVHQAMQSNGCRRDIAFTDRLDHPFTCNLKK